jgi:uncharacterized protein (TIGR02453 family)
MTSPCTRETFALLQGLEQNNTKEWYAENMDAISASCITPFAEMLGYVTNRLVGEPLQLIGGPDTTFRMNRDVRCSKDKSPYKTSVSGMLTRSGTKADMAGMSFVQLDAQGGLAAGGFYRLPTSELAKIRQRIVDQADAFSEILSKLEARGNELSDIDQLTRMPKGFTQHDGHIHAAHIKRKGFVVRRAFTPSDWMDGDITTKVTDFVRGATPLIQFGMASLRGS